MSILEQLQLFLSSLFPLLFVLLQPGILIPAIIATIVFVKRNIEYKSSAYYEITKLPYRSVKHDTGRYGEYLTYKHLKTFETNGAKFLFNVYIPKDDGKTTEIDVLMICSKGVFVFESKNYSGWIFGSEGQKNWYQTLSNGIGKSYKEHFYNPIMQNRSHIKYLKANIGEQVPMRSIIVFSDRCTLKSIQIKSNDINVINRHSVYHVVSAICDQIKTTLLSESDITNLYNKLYPYTQVSATVKAKHISNIQNNINLQQIQEIVPPIDPKISTTEQPQSEIIPATHTEAVEVKTDNANVLSSDIQTEEPTNEKIQDLKCAKCDGILILKTATRGANAGKQFYGCSNYPKCKYIQNKE